MANRFSVPSRFRQVEVKPRTFQKTCKCRETPEIDLFASRITATTLLRLMKTGPLQLREKCFPNSLDQLKRICLSPILSYRSGIKKKIQLDQAALIVVTPGWQTGSRYPHVLQMSIKNPLLLLNVPNLLIGLNKQKHQLIEKRNLHLLAWTVSGKNYLQKIIRRLRNPYYKCQKTRDSLSLRIDLA